MNKRVLVINTNPTKALINTEKWAPMIAANKPICNTPKGPVPIAADKTPKTLPLLLIGEEFKMIMVCMVENPANPKPPKNIKGNIIQ